MCEEPNNTMNTLMNTSMHTMNIGTYYGRLAVIMKVIKLLLNAMASF
jgi:hypothetical protein